MKNFLFLSILLIFSLSLSAQPVRYQDSIFSGVTITRNVQYAHSLKIQDTTLQTLKCDIYTPAGDATTGRWVLIMEHSGLNHVNSKSDLYTKRICTRFAQKGWVCLSIDFRLGQHDTSTHAYLQSVYNAEEDLKAAVRFMKRKQAVYGTDSTKIVVGGISWGATNALYAAALKTAYYVSKSIDTSFADTSSKPHTSTFADVYCWCGGVMDLSVITSTYSKPTYFIHGTTDAIFPNTTGIFNGLRLYGSTNTKAKINTIASGTSTGITTYTAGHCLAGSGQAANMRAADIAAAAYFWARLH